MAGKAVPVSRAKTAVISEESIPPSKTSKSESSLHSYRPFWKRTLSTKLLLTAGSLFAVFYLLYVDKDVSKLEILVPAILLFYNGSNVAQDVMNKRTEQLGAAKTVKTSKWAESETTGET